RPASADRADPGPAGGGAAGRGRQPESADAIRLGGRLRQLGHTERGRRVRVGRSEPDAQQRRRLRLLPDHPQHLAAVRGYRAGGAHGTTAYFPPAFPYFLAAIDVLDGPRVPAGPAVEPARIGLAALGAVTAGLVGLVALEVFGSAVGLVALALAAIYPVFVELSGTIYAENLLLALVLAAVWTA